ncbi:hypothetical protein D3C84_1044720 [compost metagenome]
MVTFGKECVVGDAAVTVLDAPTGGIADSGIEVDVPITATGDIERLPVLGKAHGQHSQRQ